MTSTTSADLIIDKHSINRGYKTYAEMKVETFRAPQGACPVCYLLDGAGHCCDASGPGRGWWADYGEKLPANATTGNHASVICRIAGLTVVWALCH